jgi:multisubunit Na+/H+ antiporter MnhC subunit
MIITDYTTILPVFSLVLIFIGMWGVATRKNLVKIFISLAIAETGVNTLFISLVKYKGMMAPIISDPTSTINYADPLPHALILTSIVIGTAVTALGLALTTRYFERKNTLNISNMKEMKN